MANIHIKNEARKAHETYALESFRRNNDVSAVEREAAEIIAARSRETYQKLKQMEDRK